MIYNSTPYQTSRQESEKHVKVTSFILTMTRAFQTMGTNINKMGKKKKKRKKKAQSAEYKQLNVV